MSKLTDVQKSIITVLDYVYFHDIVSMETFSQEKLDFYRKLLGSLKQITLNRGYADFKAELYKHMLLCGIEIYASDIRSESKGVSYNSFESNLRMELEKALEEAKFDFKHYSEDLENLIEKYRLNQIDYSLIYKLVSQILCYEFDSIALVVFVKFLNCKFLTTTKYSKESLAIDQDDFERTFFRAMLFLEFEVSKKKQLFLRDNNEKKIDINNLDEPDKVAAVILAKSKMKSLINSDYQSIVDIDVCKNNDLKEYVQSIDARLGHNSIFRGGLASWISLIGTWHLILTKKNHLNRTLYRETEVNIFEADTTCAETAAKLMYDFGFRISERTLFDHYNQISDFYYLIGISVEEIVSGERMGAIVPDLTNYFFYEPNVGDAFKAALTKVNASLKN